SGLFLREAANETSKKLGFMPGGTLVLLTDIGAVYPPTKGAPKGWRKIHTADGKDGFASDQWLEEQVKRSPETSGGIASTFYGQPAYFVESAVGAPFYGEYGYSYSPYHPPGYWHDPRWWQWHRQHPYWR